MKIRLLFAVLLSAMFHMTLIAAEPIHKNYSFTGTLYPLKTTQVSSQLQGRIQQMLVDVGDVVKKDQVIAILDSVFFDIDLKKMQTLASIAEIAVQESEIEYARMKNLWERLNGENPAISKKQFEDAATRFQQKKLAFQQAQIDLEKTFKVVDETQIKAPYDGVITHRYVDPGESITVVPVTAIYEIMDVSALRLEFNLPQDYLPYVEVGQKVILENNTIGVVDKIFPNVEISNRSIKCRVVLQSSSYLKPGLFINGTIALNDTITPIE